MKIKLTSELETATILLLYACIFTDPLVAKFHAMGFQSFMFLMTPLVI